MYISYMEYAPKIEIVTNNSNADRNDINIFKYNIMRISGALCLRVISATRFCTKITET